MARPRKHKVDVPNLYFKLDKRNNKIYWQYFHPAEQRFIGFGTDAEAARSAAIELNKILAEQATSQTYALIDMALAESKAEEKTGGTRMKEWLNKYNKIQDKRLERGGITEKTVSNRKHCVDVLNSRIKNVLLNDVGVKEMAMILEEYIDKGKVRMAQMLRGVWIDVFKEAQFAGEVPPGFNPASVTKNPIPEVRRVRLTIEDWKAIYKAADSFPAYARNAMLLAVVTGQRLGDIVKMQFRDVWDGYLHIEQEKTGAKIALPLALRCDALGVTLGEAIAQCRDKTVSRFMIHHSRSTPQIKAGSQVNRATVSGRFKTARTLAGIKASKGKTPPSFHEQRSLSERLYSAQGIDTQLLLGHSSQAMTELYHNDRSDKWSILAI